VGAWGTDIDQNDTFADVYAGFFDLYNNGASPEYASKEVQESFADYFDDYEDSSNSWFALAYAQWETKSLDTAVFEKVRDIITNGLDLKLWEELGAGKDNLQSRTKALDAFLEELSTERKTKKRRKRPKHDFHTNKLVELEAPDNEKVFTVTEEFSDGKYVHTSALMMWGTGGGSVFYLSKEGAQVKARWNDSSTITVTFEEDIEFSKQDDSAFFRGDRVTVVYKFVVE
jgi:hypothetical protein